jgi:hypothetical protein
LCCVQCRSAPQCDGVVDVNELSLQLRVKDHLMVLSPGVGDPMETTQGPQCSGP